MSNAEVDVEERDADEDYSPEAMELDQGIAAESDNASSDAPAGEFFAGETDPRAAALNAGGKTFLGKLRAHEDAVVELLDAKDAMIDLLEDGDVPDQCRNFELAIREAAGLIDRLSQFYDNAVGFSKVIESHMRDMAGAAALPPLKPLEKIEELAALPGMGREQIARIYGFVDRNGEPMFKLVTMELDSPGSVIGPAAKGLGLIDGKDWEDPREVERRKKYGRRPALKAGAISQVSGGKRFKPCPESPKDLWLQNVSVEQSARMLGVPQSSVEGMFGQFEREREIQRAERAAVDAAAKAEALKK